MSQKIPNVPPKLPFEQRRLLEAVRESIEVGEGVRGDPLLRKLTVKDLITLGMIQIRDGFGLRDLNRAGSGGLMPVYVGPVLDLTPPPRPLNLVVVGAITSLMLVWDEPLYANHSYVEIWRHSVDNLALAVLLGTSPSFMYTDTVDPGQTYYYWVRFVSTADVAGPYNATAGTVGTSALDPSALLEALQGELDESQWTIALQTRITSIDNPLTGSVATEALARATAITAEAKSRTDGAAQELIDQTAAIKVETDARVYQTGLIIEDLGTLADTVAHPTSGLAATSLALGELDQRVVATETSFGIQSSDITALQNTINDPETGLAVTNTAFEALSSALLQEVDSLSSTSDKVFLLLNSVFDPLTGMAAQSTALDTLNSTVYSGIDGVGATSARLTSLESTVNDIIFSDFNADTTYLVGDQFKSGGTLYEVIATQTPPNAAPPNATYYLDQGDYTGLSETVAANSQAVDALETTVNHTVSGVTASADRLGLLEATVDTPDTGLSAKVGSVETALVDPIDGLSASAGRLDTLEATVDDPDIGLSAKVTTVELALVDPESGLGALATRASVLETSADDLVTGGEVSSQATEALTTSALFDVLSQSSTSAKVVSLESTIEDPLTGIAATSTALASLSTSVTEAEDTIIAQSADIVLLKSAVDDPVTGVSASATGLDSLTTKVRHSESGLVATASRVGYLEATVDDPENGLSAKVLTVETAIADSESGLGALATKTTTLETSAGVMLSLATDPYFGQNDKLWSGSYEGETVAPLDNYLFNGSGLEIAGQQWLYGTKPIRVDTGRIYEVSFKVRQTVAPTTGGAKVYAGVATLDGSYQPITGGAGTHRYCAVGGATLTVADGWVSYQGDITGEGLDYDEFRPGTVFIRPMCIVNNSGGNGTVEVAGLDFKDVTDARANMASLQIHGESINGLSAQYTVKMDVNGRVAGYGLASGPTSPDDPINFTEFSVLVDRFSIASPGNADLIFSVDTVNHRVVMDAAYIVNLVAKSAQIEDLAVTSAKMADLAVTSAKIAEGAVTNLKIGNTIQSNGYDGNNGWLIDKNGGIFCSNLNARGTLTGAIIRGSIIDGGVFIGDTEMTVATDDDTGTGTRSLAYRALVASNSLSELRTTGLWSSYLNITSGAVLIRSYNDRGSVTAYEGGSVYTGFERWQQAAISPYMSAVWGGGGMGPWRSGGGSIYARGIVEYSRQDHITGVWSVVDSDDTGYVSMGAKTNDGWSVLTVGGIVVNGRTYELKISSQNNTSYYPDSAEGGGDAYTTYEDRLAYLHIRLTAGALTYSNGKAMRVRAWCEARWGNTYAQTSRSLTLSYTDDQEQYL